MEITMRPVNNVRNLFMHKVIFTIITKPSWRKLFSCNNWGYTSLWNMHVLPKAFSPTVPCHWSLWKLLKVSAMTVSERLASALTLSYTLKYLNAISAKKSFLSSVILFNTLEHNTACDVCEKNSLQQVMLCTIPYHTMSSKLNEVCWGWRSQKLIQSWPKIIQKY